MASMAMRMSLDFLTKNWGLGSGQRRKRKWFSQELEQTGKESRFSLCLVKKVIKCYNTNKLNKYNINHV